MFFDKVYYDEDNKSVEVQMLCDKCGSLLSVCDTHKFETIKSDYCIVKSNEIVNCNSCSNRAKGIIRYKQNLNINNIIVNKKVI